MKNSRFEKSPYGSVNRAGERDKGAVSAWWNDAVREKLGSEGGKKPKNSDRAKNSNSDG